MKIEEFLRLHPLPSFLCDENLRVISANSAFEELNLKHLIVRKLSEFPDGWKSDEASAVSSPGGTCKAVLTGEEGPLYIVVLNPVKEAGGKPLFLGALETLKPNSFPGTDRLQFVIEAIGAGTWELNLNTDELVVNQQWADVLGYTQSELNNLTIQSLEELYHPDDRGAAHKALVNHLSGDAAFFDVELRLRHKLGHWTWVRLRGSVIAWSSATQPEIMYGTCLDISDYKIQQETLIKNERFLKRAGEVAGVGGWELDLVNQSLSWTQHTFAIHEVEEDYVPDLNTAITFYAPEARPVIIEAVENAIKHGTSWNLELPFVTAKGRKIWVNAVGEPEYTGSEVTSLFGTFRDITNQVELYNELDVRRKEAEFALAERSRLFAKISHELRTPLNGITGMLSSAISENDPGKLHDKINVALQSADILMSVVNDALDFSKINSGDFQLEPSYFQIKSILNNLSPIYSEACRRKGITFSCRSENVDEHWLYIDETRLNQVLINLLNNALKFTKEGGVSLSMALLVAEAPGTSTLHIVVEDTGIGIGLDEQERLFKPFAQANEHISSTYGGSGLGLSIVKEIIDAMEGSITLTSQIAAGTRFEISLPVRTTMVQDPQKDHSLPVAIDIPDEFNVLVVDDNEINRMVMGSFLEEINILPDFANNGIEAIEKCRNRHYQLIFMDCVMPEMNGLDATKHIREADGLNRNAFIVALTANTSASDREAAAEAGMDEFIAKPVKSDNIRTIVQKQINNMMR